MSSGNTPRPGPSLAAKQLKQLQSLAKNKADNPEPTPANLLSTVNNFKLGWTELDVTKEEVFVGYLNFLRGLPNFVQGEKDKIIKTVRDKLKIGEIEQSLSSLSFEKLLHIKEGSYIIDQLSAKLGQSLR